MDIYQSKHISIYLKLIFNTYEDTNMLQRAKRIAPDLIPKGNKVSR